MKKEIMEDKNILHTSKEIFYDLKPRICLFIGAPESGKTHMIRYLMYVLAKKKFFRFGKIFSQTAEFNDDYDYLPRHYLEEWKEEKAQAYVDKIKNVVKTQGNKKLGNNFLILDDLLGVMDPHTNFLKHLASIHRHLKMTIFLTSQYLANNVSTLLRSICNHAFIFPGDDWNSHQLLWKAFGSSYYKFEEFQQVLKKAREVPHRCVFYTRKTKASAKKDGDKKENDTFMYYQAPHVPKFRIHMS